MRNRLGATALTRWTCVATAIVVAGIGSISSGAANASGLVADNMSFNRVISPISSDYDFSNISDFDVATSGEIYVLQATTRTILCLTDFGLLNCRMPIPQEVLGEARSIAILPDGRILIGASGLYLLDYNGEFERRIDRAESPILTQGKIAFSPAARRTGPETVEPAATSGSENVTLYVQRGNQVIAVDLEGRIKATYGAGEIQSLRGVAVDGAGLVYTLDQGSYRVRVFRPDGRLLRAFGRAGGKPGTFGLVNGIGVMNDGSVWVSDVTQSAFHVFDAEGNFRHVVTIPTPMGGIIERGGEVFLGSKTLPGIVVLVGSRETSVRTN